MSFSTDRPNTDSIELISNTIFPQPTYAYHEVRVRDMILTIVRKRGLEVEVDETGNVYVSNGPPLDAERDSSGRNYPCVVAHMDTVHSEHIEHIHGNIELDVRLEGGIYTAYDPITGKQTGIGGDDKAGVVIALSLLLYSDIDMKAAFFISEENGCQGSGNLNKPNLLSNVGCFIQFDAPGNNWASMSCSSIQLFHKEFKEEKLSPILEAHGRYEDCFSQDPFTDAKELRVKFGVCCVNLFAGYYGMHTPYETVSKAEMKESESLGYDLMKELGNERFDFPFKPRSVQDVPTDHDLNY